MPVLSTIPILLSLILVYNIQNITIMYINTFKKKKRIYDQENVK